MKAAIYSRFSTDRQTESSIADQVRVCTEYAAAQGWHITAHYEDQGISGAALGNRPGAGRLLEAAFAGALDVVLVVDLSRLSRSTGDLNKMIDRLVARRIRVIGIQDGYDSARKGHKLQAGFSGVIGEAFREMVSDRTYVRLESLAKEGKPTGGRAYGYNNQSVDEALAEVVREIFARYAAGESCRTIAADLNSRGIPSPGSSWSRTTRRANGWMGSAIRSMLRNERYAGTIHWNTSEWVKDPDSGKRIRRENPRSEWISRRDEGMRIVTDELFQRAQQRTRGVDSKPVRTGGAAKYLLSGLLRCATCDAHYVIADARSYACSSHLNGGACSNGVRVTRVHAENTLLGKLREDLLAPESVRVIAQDMHEYFREQAREGEKRAVEQPRELQELDARLARLRERLRVGDPDMPADELQAAVYRAEEKRGALLSAQPATRASAKILAMLPKAAEGARREIAAALAGDSRASLKARVMLREAYSGRIDLKRDEAGGLVAHWNLNSMALLRSAGTVGSGGVLSPVPALPQSVRLK